MKSGVILALVAATGCSPTAKSETPEAENSDELTIEVVSEECERLIGVINAGRVHVDEVGTHIAATGGDDLEARARALEAVAGTVIEPGYATPDLERLGGFYASIAITKARVLREMNAAVAKTDEAALQEATKRFEQLGQQEDIVVEEVNVQCRGPRPK